MQRLFPDRLDEPDDDALAQSYAWPVAGPPRILGSRGVSVRANMVASLDGRAALSGTSGGLSNPADQHLMELMRDLADVVLLGAGTVRSERYPGVRSGSDRRSRWGFDSPPPVAVVTRGGLDPELPVFTDTIVAPIVLTTTRAAREMSGLPATVIGAGADALDLPLALRRLGDLGLTRVQCEGGPSLLAQLLDADLIDELCLTVAPVLLGGAAIGLLADHDLVKARPWELVGLHRDADHLFTRYRRPGG